MESIVRNRGSHDLRVNCARDDIETSLKVKARKLLIVSSNRSVPYDVTSSSGGAARLPMLRGVGVTFKDLKGNVTPSNESRRSDSWAPI
jgi:hypothetical protein